MRQELRRFTAVAAALALTAAPAFGQTAPIATPPMVTPQPDPTPDVAAYANGPASVTDRTALIAALRDKVKYVFVIFNENHSFDNEFGTFPGVNGLFSDGAAPRDAAHTPGFAQSYRGAGGEAVTLRPFRIGPQQNATVVDSVDHSHSGLAKKLDVKNGVAAMDGFAADEYERYAAKGGNANVAMGMQYARLVMSYIDCDTVPFFWRWASRFTLFDNIFATEDTPSTPNAVAMIAGQSGETQWVEHGAEGASVAANGTTAKLQGVPLVNDPQPFWGSQYDSTTTDREPRGSMTGESYAAGNVATNLTFASLPLAFAGPDAANRMGKDRAPDTDLADIKQDIPFIQSHVGKPVEWRWYQEGYDHEPTDPTATATHDGYVSHHNGAQYFGYIANNPAMSQNLRGLGDFFADAGGGKLPQDGGVFYIRGGFTNLAKLTPPIQNPGFPAQLTDADRATIAKAKDGDDDHPSYSDRQVSEAMAARVINAVAGNPDLWRQSAIVLTYDESDGFYDHVAPRILSYGPDGLPLARGIRIPMIVVSPYARAHVVSHAEGDHNAVMETIEAIYGLPPLASLPEEADALKAGEAPKFNGPNGFVQHYLGPRDLNTPATDDLLSAFDPDRLAGTKKLLPASLAMIPEDVVAHLPHYDGQGCQAVGITPEDRRQNITNSVPAHFNTLPATLPTYN